jgi:hypothetical protein
MRFAILGYILFCLPIVQAASDQDLVRALARARSSAELRRVTGLYEELKIARAACRLQLRAKSTPFACYESLQLEIRRGYHSSISERRHLTERLDKLCEDAAVGLIVPREPAADPILSPKCRKFLREARAIRNYREQRPDWSEN